MADIEGLGSKWRRLAEPDIYHSPPAEDVGPNQLLLLDDFAGDNFFRNGTIRAVVQFCAPQPQRGIQAPELGLVGRYTGPGCYITGGAGGEGHKFYIAEVRDGTFSWEEKKPAETTIGTSFDLELQLEDEIARLRLYLDGVQAPVPVAEKKVASRNGGRCGLRANWTEGLFSYIKSESNDDCCFVIAPIGMTGSAARLHSDRVLEQVIRPALARCGYNAKRADEMSPGCPITEDVRRHVRDDDLIVADLTGSNPNVYYEVGLRHAHAAANTEKRTIHVIGGTESLPFDLKDIDTVRVDFSSEEMMERARAEICRRIPAPKKKR